MRRALHDGGRGIAPSDRPLPTAATKAVPLTRATTVLAGGRGGPQAPVQTRRPRQGPQRGARPAPATTPEQGRRSSGRGRLVGLMLGLMALVLIIVAVVVISSPKATEVRLRNVVYPEIQQAAAALRQLVAENTQ